MRIDSETKRIWYLQESIANNWSVRNLERNINTFYFERILSSRDNVGSLTIEESFQKHTSNDFISDPYVFEFLNIPELMPPVNETWNLH